MALFEMHCNILQLTFDILFNIHNLLNSIIIIKKSFVSQVCLMTRHHTVQSSDAKFSMKAVKKLLVAGGAPRVEVNKIKRSTIVEQWKKLIGDDSWGFSAMI